MQLRAVLGVGVCCAVSAAGMSVAGAQGTARRPAKATAGAFVPRMRATTLALRAAAGVQPSWPSYCGTRPSRTHLRSVAELVPIRSATSRCDSLSLFAASVPKLPFMCVRRVDIRSIDGNSRLPWRWTVLPLRGA